MALDEKPSRLLCDEFEGSAAALRSAKDERSLHCGRVNIQRRERPQLRAGSGTYANRRVGSRQLGVVGELTTIVAAAAGDSSLAERTWVLITESPEGG